MLTHPSWSASRLITTTPRHGKAIVIDGHSLSIPALVAAARHNAQIVLNGSAEIRTRVQKSRDIILEKVKASKSVYGVSTGFGGSGELFPRCFVLGLVSHHHSSS
jgi:phenylalanine ammonia-lyase